MNPIHCPDCKIDGIPEPPSQEEIDEHPELAAHVAEQGENNLLGLGITPCKRHLNLTQDEIMALAMGKLQEMYPDKKVIFKGETEQ